MVAAISCTNSILSISDDGAPGSAGGAISSLVCNVARSPRFQAASRLLAQRSEAVKGLVSFIFILAAHIAKTRWVSSPIQVVLNFIKNAIF
jgi:hypothetical protein